MHADVITRIESIAAAAQDYGNDVHLPKTLDGSYYLGLHESDIDMRDDDQGVSKDWKAYDILRHTHLPSNVN
jgi:hypothetical protein